MDDRQRRVDECRRRLRELAADIRVIVARLRELQFHISLETYYVAGPSAHSGNSHETAESLRAIQRRTFEMQKLSQDLAGSRRHLQLELALLNNLIAAGSGTRQDMPSPGRTQ